MQFVVLGTDLLAALAAQALEIVIDLDPLGPQMLELQIALCRQAKNPAWVKQKSKHP